MTNYVNTTSSPLTVITETIACQNKSAVYYAAIYKDPPTIIQRNSLLVATANS